ncbi:MAG: MerR family transcriptional regulator [Formosimonas sp.]
MSPTDAYVLTQDLPAIPAKRYFTIGEVSTLCGVRSYVLRYWEQEFSQLRPMKRRGNRRYYQHHEVLLVRKIRELLYEQGYTIQGARQQLEQKAAQLPMPEQFEMLLDNTPELDGAVLLDDEGVDETVEPSTGEVPESLLTRLRAVRDLLNRP